jgi:hypothetical protein
VAARRRRHPRQMSRARRTTCWGLRADERKQVLCAYPSSASARLDPFLIFAKKTQDTYVPDSVRQETSEEAEHALRVCCSDTSMCAAVLQTCFPTRATPASGCHPLAWHTHRYPGLVCHRQESGHALSALPSRPQPGGLVQSCCCSATARAPFAHFSRGSENFNMLNFNQLCDPPDLWERSYPVIITEIDKRRRVV